MKPFNKWLTLLVINGIFMTSVWAGELTITSDAFRNAGPIPEEYSCDGQNHSPALTFSNIPEKTKSLVLIVSDPDAPSGIWYHWIIYNLSPTTAGIKMNEKPTSGIMGKNSYSNTQYAGPCPPVGSLPHHYIFTLYALDTELNFPTTPDAKTVEKALKNHVIQSTTLTGIYKRK